MGSGVTGGGGGSAGQGLRVDTTTLAGGGWQRRGKAVKAAAAAAGGIILMVVRKIFCSFFLPDGRHLVIGEVTPHQLPTTIVTQFCGHTEFLRALGHEKGRVQNLNSNPEVMPRVLRYFHVGIIAVEISRTGPITTVMFFLYS
jgi:hypothetical protein